MQESSQMEQNNGTRGESKYERLRRIGVGSYGVVFKCVNRLTGQIVAIKRYSENDSDPIIRKIAMREVRMLRQLRHPNLIYLIEVFRRKRRLHLVFNYCELTVLDVIEKYGNSCPLNLIRKIVWQIVNGINYCHSHNCIHRDIKPENILINQSGVVKLCDFGFARTINNPNGRISSQSSSRIFSNFARDIHELQEPDSNKENPPSTNIQYPNHLDLANSERQALTEYVATRWYRAPELLIGEIYYDIKIDIWAIGCVTAELMRGEPIWPGKTDLDQLFIIKSSLGQLTESQAETLISQGIYDQASIERLLGSSANLSSSLERKLPSRVGDGGIDFVSSCLQMDPARRPTSEELLKHGYIYSAKMQQFMKEASSANYNNNGNYAHDERASVSGDIVESSAAHTRSGGNQLVVRQAQRSNSQSLALVAASQGTQGPRQQNDGGNVGRQQQQQQAGSKRLIVANEQVRPQQMPIAERMNSPKSRFKRKQPDTKAITPIKTKPSLVSPERNCLVPVARDRVLIETERPPILNGLSKFRSERDIHKTTLPDSKMAPKNQRERLAKSQDKSTSNNLVLGGGLPRKNADRKQLTHNERDNQLKSNIYGRDTSTRIGLKCNIRNGGNNKTDAGQRKQQIDSSASSTQSDTTSFLPSLFPADDPRKAKYTSQR